MRKTLAVRRSSYRNEGANLNVAPFRADMRRPLFLLAAAAVAAAFVIGLVQSSGEDDAGDAPELITPGEAARRLSGAPVPLAALHVQGSQLLGGGPAAYRRRLRDLLGYPVVVNKWGSWCGPCRAEFPFFNRAGVRYGKRVAFLGVDIVDNREEARRFLKDVPVPFPSYEDPRGRLAPELGGAQATPSTLFLDADGKEAYLHQGAYRSEADLAADIDRYLLGAAK